MIPHDTPGVLSSKQTIRTAGAEGSAKQGAAAGGLLVRIVLDSSQNSQCWGGENVEEKKRLSHPFTHQAISHVALKGLALKFGSFGDVSVMEGWPIGLRSRSGGVPTVHRCYLLYCSGEPTKRNRDLFLLCQRACCTFACAANSSSSSTAGEKAPRAHDLNLVRRDELAGRSPWLADKRVFGVCWGLGGREGVGGKWGVRRRQKAIKVQFETVLPVPGVVALRGGTR